MKKLSERLDGLFEAVTACAGETDGAGRERRRGKYSNKKVLLGAEGAGIDHKAFSYVLNLCRRVGASLEILYVLRPSETDDGRCMRDLLADAGSGLGPVLDRLEEAGIGYRLNFGEGRLGEEVAKYAEGRRDILCVVIKAPGGDERERRPGERPVRKALDRLRCPLAVIYDTDGG